MDLDLSPSILSTYHAIDSAKSSFGFFWWPYAETNSAVFHVLHPDDERGSLYQPPSSAHSSFVCWVPTLTDIVKISCNDMLCENIHIVRASSVKKVKVSIDNINEIGTDLLSNAVEGSSLYDSNVIIVDFGTALTFTVVSKNNEVLGVNIVPGLKTAINSLYKNTANLPVIDLEIPDKVIGKNTIHSIQSGIMYGYIGLVKEMILKIKSELIGDTKVIATGGLSKFAKPLKSEFNDIIPSLTLDGMLKILDDYEKEWIKS